MPLYRLPRAPTCRGLLVFNSCSAAQEIRWTPPGTALRFYSNLHSAEVSREMRKAWGNVRSREQLGLRGSVWARFLSGTGVAWRGSPLTPHSAPRSLPG